MKGKFYAVSVGTGDPELMTLKSINTLKKCDVILAPINVENESMGYKIIKEVIDLEGKEIIKLPRPTEYSPYGWKKHHLEVADLIEPMLRDGKNVAILNLGDVSIYSGVFYLTDKLTDDGFEFEIVSGITSVCSVAAKLGISLTEINGSVHIIPSENIDEAFTVTGTRVLMKLGKSLPEVLRKIREHNLTDKCMTVQNCGMPDEKIYKNIEDIDELSQFTTIIIKE